MATEEVVPTWAWVVIGVLAALSLPTLVRCVGGCAYLCNGRQRKRPAGGPGAKTDLSHHRVLALPYRKSGASGLWLYARKWDPAPGVPVRAILYIVHGWGEYIDRYEPLARALNERGIIVAGHDLEGHGRSEGERGIIERVSDNVADVVERVAEMRWAHRDVPIFLMGHSLGGLIAAYAANGLRSKGEIAGLILSSAFLEPSPELVSPAIICIGRMLANLIPRMRITGVDPNDLAHDAVWNEWYTADPLIQGLAATTALGREVLDMQKELPTIASEFTGSVFLFHGDADKLAYCPGSRNYHDRCGSTDKTIEIIPGGKHELLFDTDGAELQEKLIRWILTRGVALPEDAAPASAAAGAAGWAAGGSRRDVGSVGGSGSGGASGNARVGQSWSVRSASGWEAAGAEDWGAPAATRRASSGVPAAEAGEVSATIPE